MNQLNQLKTFLARMAAVIALLLSMLTARAQKTPTSHLILSMLTTQNWRFPKIKQRHRL